MTLQLKENSSPTGNAKKTYSKQKFSLETTEKVVLRPNNQDVSIVNTNDELTIDPSATKELLPNFERKTGWCFTQYFGRLGAECQMQIRNLNIQLTVITVPEETLVANVTFLSPQQVHLLQPVNQQLMKDYINRIVKELIASSNSPRCFCNPKTVSDFKHRKRVKNLIE